MKTMINKFLISLVLIALTMPAYADKNKPVFKYPEAAPRVHLQSLQAGIDIHTNKVARLYGDVDYQGLMRFTRDMDATANLPGDRVILINSNGGQVPTGQIMINLIKDEQARGTRVVCYVEASAHSMAFNFLTHCDVRLMSPNGMSLVHKAAKSTVAQRFTARNLRILADQLDKDDEPYRQANAAAMHLTLAQYDTYADTETYWRSKSLYDIGYLQGIGHLVK